MKFAVGFQLYDPGEEPFSRIVSTYREHISEVFFAWQDTPSGRSGVATRHGFTDWSAQQRTEEELRAIKAMGVKLDLLFNGNCYGQYAISEKLANTVVFRRKELAYRLLSVVFDDSAVRNLAQAEGGHIVPGVRLLQQSYLENIPVGRFAEACDMSVSAFRRQFVQAYGISPVQYRNRLRVNRARQLLADGSCTVTEAAYASGFENLGYFCRCYKKLTGETPNETKCSEA